MPAKVRHVPLVSHEALVAVSTPETFSFDYESWWRSPEGIFRPSRLLRKRLAGFDVQVHLAATGLQQTTTATALGKRREEQYLSKRLKPETQRTGVCQLLTVQVPPLHYFITLTYICQWKQKATTTDARKQTSEFEHLYKLSKSKMLAADEKSYLRIHRPW